jgi:hypothetical protein
LISEKPNATLSGRDGEQREPPVRWSVKFDTHLILADLMRVT